MPAFKMKIKSKTNFLREYIHNSTKISKSSRSQFKSLDKKIAVDPSNLSSWKAVPCNIEVAAQNVGIIEANNCQDTNAGDSTQLLKLLLSSPDSASFEGIEPMMASCPSNLETIFSTGFDKYDQQFKATIPYYPVGEERSQLPYLFNEVDDESFIQFFSSVDFYFSDNFTALPVTESTGLNEIMNIPCPDYEIVNSNAILGMEERPTLLPVLDVCPGNICPNDDKSVGEHIVDRDDSCLYLAIHQLKVPDQEAQIRYFSGDIEETTGNSLSNSHISSSYPPLLRTERGKHNTLVLDLDETLVHSKLEHCDDADFSFPVFFNMKQHTVYVRQRPCLQMFLERVAEMFRVVIFTASQSIYAESLVNILDPDRKLISQRFYRESCIFSDGSYTKDLTILGVDLAKVVIIDNSPHVFRLQVDNGIPIKSWFDDPTDQALNSLLPFLENLADADDVRPFISRTFGNIDEQTISVH